VFDVQSDPVDTMAVAFAGTLGSSAADFYVRNAVFTETSSLLSRSAILSEPLPI